MKTVEGTPGEASRVSVIVPSRDSERTIHECLKSIISQTHKPIEIILVDSLSKDSTAEIAKSMGAIVVLHDYGRSAQKNYGAKLAKGDFLYFVDSDFRLEPDAIADCLRAIEGVDGAVIRNQDVPHGSKLSQLIASRRRILSYDPLNIAVRFVKRDVFESLGGFDPQLYIGQDTDFHRRFLHHGFKMKYSTAREWHLGSPESLQDFLRGTIYYSPNLVKSASKDPLYSLKRINPLQTLSAWKKSDARSSDLIPVLLLGLLSITSLFLGALLSLPSREGPSKRSPS